MPTTSNIAWSGQLRVDEINKLGYKKSRFCVGVPYWREDVVLQINTTRDTEQNNHTNHITSSTIKSNIGSFE